VPADLLLVLFLVMIQAAGPRNIKIISGICNNAPQAYLTVFEMCNDEASSSSIMYHEAVADYTDRENAAKYSFPSCLQDHKGPTDFPLEIVLKPTLSTYIHRTHLH
jgi:hypothetical protein